MAIHITALRPGDELQCWMRLGLALKPVVKGDGTPYYIVPPKPTTAASGDLTRFIGWVVVNDPGLRYLTLHVSAMNSWQQAVVRGTPRQADIAYSVFQRIRRYSKVTTPGKPEVASTVGGKGWRRPGSIAPFNGTANRPYRTVEEVRLR